MISFSIFNFGCRVNQAEAFSWADELQKNGLKLEKDHAGSDLVLINSCTLTSRADRDVIQAIKKIPRLNPKAKIIVTGCLVERDYDGLKNLPQIWQVFRNTEKDDLASKILSLIDSQKKYILPAIPYRSRALLKVQDGCDFCCTFCIIPGVRGKSISFSEKEILAQAEKFKKQGYKEIVLTGIHLSSYGSDLIPKTTLLELLQKIENVNDLQKLRLSSLDPRFLNRSLLEFITSSKKICPHFHVSLQHGSESVLKRMGRKIRISDFNRILKFLRQHSQYASLGADIIVGFPEESEDDFQQTLIFLEKSPLTYFHVFPFSPRPGTPASAWPQVDGKIKKERARILRSLSEKKNKSFRSQFIGRELEGIVVKKNEKGAEILTSNYIKISVPFCSQEEREEVIVIVKKVTKKETFGEVF